MNELLRATAPLAWDAPRHLVLRAVRGTLVAMQAPGALLVVVLESGSSAEELRMPMEAAVGRMLRHLRQPTGAKSTPLRENAETSLGSEPRAPLPVGMSSDPTSKGPTPVPAADAGRGYVNTGNGEPQSGQ